MALGEVLRCLDKPPNIISDEFYADGVAMVSSRRLVAGQENGSQT